MFIPIQDDNPLRSIPYQYVTLGLIAVNVAIFLLQATGIDERVVASFAVVPNELFRAGFFGPGAGPGPHDAVAVPERLTLLSYMFFHGDPMHLIGNMLFLWVFGDNVEDAMGHAKFLAFYLLCGIFAGFTHAAISSASGVPLIGASGAVAGVIAAYIMLHPRVQVWVLALRVIPLRISAALALGAWILTQVVMVLLPQVGPVAWWAHIGGLVAGALLVVVMRRPGVPLFDRGLGAR
ncbi:MAG: rhomboid family intramembrane serine protease [Hyphomicrobiaceae bacterium]|nr:rhomboid family intramembrane serine protease [Hyphomicrobiaceae bacterium]